MTLHKMDSINLNYLKQLFFDLVNIESTTSSSGEKTIETFILNTLSEMSYFKKHPEFFGEFIIENDVYNRSVVWGLVKGESKDTIILMNHHDVVDVYDYGNLIPFAYQPDQLKSKLKELNLPEEVQGDLESDEWIFGRGTCDMKAGSAIQLALLKQYSCMKNFKGNLLFISVPDEEALSAGMRSGVSLLKTIKDQFDLEYKLLINSEPHQREKADTGILFEGSVGKIMPVIMVKGKKTHIGDVFQGFNPVRLLTQIVNAVDLNLSFSDTVGDEVSPPPTWNYVRDMKKCYDASTPEFAGGYFSALTLSSSPKEILEKLRGICETAFIDVINDMNEKYAHFLKMQNKPVELLPWQVKVKLFSEVYEEARTQGGSAFEELYHKAYNEFSKKVENGAVSLPEATFDLIEKTLAFLPDQDPVIVIAISPPYYPHITNKMIPGSEIIPEIIKQIQVKAFECRSETYETRNYFMGISDVSYFSAQKNDEIISLIQENIPMWGQAYSIPFEDMKGLEMPVINIGPWGKDLHKFTERVYQGDVFESTPHLIQTVIEHVLSD